MKKYVLFTLLAFVCVLVNAQVNEKYLAGAVPEVDGKVVFSKTIGLNNGISDDALFDQVNDWANGQYNSENNRILLVNKEDKEIACKGEADLVFKTSFLVLDKAVMSYQLVLDIKDAKCNMLLRNIRYKYADDNFAAENSITDKEALSGKKLNRYYGKFRTYTIDSVNAIFKSLEAHLVAVNTPTTPAAPSIVQTITATPLTPATPIVAASPASVAAAPAENQAAATAPMAGFKAVSADKIPGNYIKLLSNATLISSGKGDKQNVMAASWGGIGTIWEKPVALCFLNPTRYSVTTMDSGDTYTISFYTEAYKDAVLYCGSNSGRNTDKIKGSGLTPIHTPSGALAFSEAWMILECRKLLSQPIQGDAITDKSIAEQWSKDGYHKMYVGEIINVWIK